METGDRLLGKRAIDFFVHGIYALRLPETGFFVNLSVVARLVEKNPVSRPLVSLNVASFGRSTFGEMCDRLLGLWAIDLIYSSDILFGSIGTIPSLA
ncbi:MULTISPECIES: hypothetical protein [unclassified Microcoleus]|uniref:hypothetical protein n=1 Tax=unclassified Microcoleus TaxID=2642155 RepID=UPI002FD58830